MKKPLLLIILLAANTMSFAQTFNAGACPMGTPIPDNNATGVTIPITVSGVSGQLGINVWVKQVKLNITHSWDDDLDITLYSPDSYNCSLSTDNGDAGDNYGGGCGNPTVFTMSAPDFITAGTPPFLGSYVPECTFYFFHISNVSPNGVWNLKVIDDEGANIGTVDYAEIEFTTVNSISENIPENNFTIYPNPSSGVFQVKSQKSKVWKSTMCWEK